jgi:acyl-CoA thioesterase FadM
MFAESNYQKRLSFEESRHESASTVEERLSFEQASQTIWMYGIVLPNAVDNKNMMQKAKYLYELQISRREFFARTGILRCLSQSQATLQQRSQKIDYFHSLGLWQHFKVEMRITSWNFEDLSFTLESGFYLMDETGQSGMEQSLAALHEANYLVTLPPSHNSPASREELLYNLQHISHPGGVDAWDGDTDCEDGSSLPGSTSLVSLVSMVSADSPKANSKSSCFSRTPSTDNQI